VIPIAQPHISNDEKHAVLKVLESGQLAQGSRVQAFEDAFAAYCGVRHAVATSSGTTALHTALLAHGIGPGDEVITTPFSFIATANAILHCGARPVFVDIEPDTFNLDPKKVEAAITPATRALLPVHLYGHPADMAALMRIAGEHGLSVIEDAAQAHGAVCQGQPVGTWGTGCFSFYPTKNMTTAEGGIVTTDDDGIADRARMIRNHGQCHRYEHHVLGYNYRMTDLHAAISLVQISHLEEWNLRRIENAAYLTAHLCGVVTPSVRPGCRHVFHQYTIRVPSERDRLAAWLQECGIGTGIHYPCPIHRQPLYRGLGYDDNLPQAEAASREVLSLPVHPGLSQDDLSAIVSAVCNDEAFQDGRSLPAAHPRSREHRLASRFEPR
jgi:dTDP-4-amino-4,6-dideoxygalactose transaminase